MDALKALAGQQGCSTDGTAASRNPLSQLVNQIGKDGRPIGPQAGGPLPPQAVSEIGMQIQRNCCNLLILV